MNDQGLLYILNSITSQEMKRTLSLYLLSEPCIWASSKTYAGPMSCLAVARKGCS